MDNDFGRDLRDACGCDRYPQGFLEEYEPFECLANSETCETLLVKNKRTGMFYVAKCYNSGGGISHTTEAEILKKLQHAGLPRFVDEYHSEDMFCVVREYVEGVPLDEWAAQRKLDTAAAVRIAIALCGLLQHLHSLSPPIIHRDIKPQNLIVDADGQLWLIDFGISRLYQEESKADTACWGTQDFAAPEQYGYAQTDVRSDIYSFGILLGWLLTGKTRREEILPKIGDRRLWKIISKCTAFAPKDRYTSASRVCADLAALDGNRLRKMLLRFGVAALCVLCLYAGFTLGRHTDLFTPAETGVIFTEPLIGQAVRLTLGLTADAPVTQAELLGVTALYVCGNQPAQDAAAYHLLTEDITSPFVYGGITSLADLAGMPNLSAVNLSRQNIADLSPLAGLEGLRQLDLRHNPLSDVSPLAQCKGLDAVCLFDTRVEDVSPFAACAQLQSLDVGGTFITSVAALDGCLSLQQLWLGKTTLQTLDGVQSLTNLRDIKLSQVLDGDLSLLMQLPHLQTLILANSMQSAAQATLSAAPFTISYAD